MFSIHPIKFDDNPYFIYWSGETEQLGVTDGGTVVYQEKLNRNRRSEFLKQELDDDYWELIIRDELKLKDLSPTLVTISRGTRTVELKVVEDIGKELIKIMGKLVNISNKSQRIRFLPPLPQADTAEPIKRKESPIKKSTFAIPLKKRILEYREEVVE